MRDTFVKEVYSLVACEKKAIIVTGDHGYSLFDRVREDFPDQFLNVGIAEQSAVGVAAGLTKVGFRPLVYGLASFMPMRALEQVRLDIVNSSRPVIIFGDGAGLTYGPLGVSHHCIEDIAALRAMNGLRIFSPADGVDMSQAINEAWTGEGPSYIRIGKADLTALQRHHGNRSCSKGIEYLTDRGHKVTVVATGSMVSLCQQALVGLPICLVNAKRLAPWTPEELREELNPTEIVLTFEEHSTSGGLGDLISEGLGATGTRVHRFGVSGRSNQVCGSWTYLIEMEGLSVTAIRDRVTYFISP